MAICFMLLAQADLRAASFALANTGNKIAARIAIIAITTSSSISVKPVFLLIIVPSLPKPLWQHRLSTECRSFSRR